MLSCYIAFLVFVLRCAVLCFVLLPLHLRDNNACIQTASAIANIEDIWPLALEFIENGINIDFLFRLHRTSSLLPSPIQEIPRLMPRSSINTFTNTFRLVLPCTTRHPGAISGRQRFWSEWEYLRCHDFFESSAVVAGCPSARLKCGVSRSGNTPVL